MDKINILQLITDLDVGGAEKLVLHLCRHLNPEQYKVFLAYLQGNAPLIAKKPPSNCHLIRAPLAASSPLQAVLSIRDLIKKLNIHILHTHLIRADFCGFIAGKLSSVPVIVSTRHNTNYFRGMSTFWSQLDRFMTAYRTATVAVSNAVRDFYVGEGSKASKFHIIYNSIDTEHFISFSERNSLYDKLCLDRTCPVVSTVGSLTTQKGHKYLLEAIPFILKDCDNVKFLIVGDGPLRKQLEQLADSLDIKNHVIFTGIWDDVREVMDASQVVVLPSLWEGFGLVLLEAMAMKKPVIASAVDGIPEVVATGQTGLLVPPQDSYALAQAITRLLQNSNLRNEMGESGKKRVFQKYDPATMTRQYESLYETLLETHGKDTYEKYAG